MNIPGPADLRPVLAAERLREAALPVAAPAAPSAVGAVRTAAQSTSPGGGAAPAAAAPRAPPAAPAPPALSGPPGEEAVEVSPRARLLAAIDRAGETLGRATRALAVTDPPAGGAAGAAAPASPSPGPPAPAIPPWVAAAVATLTLPPRPAEPGHERPQRDGGSPGGRAAHPAGRLVAVLPALGAVAIDIGVGPDGVTVRFVAAPEAAGCLAGGAPELEAALAGRGLALAAHEVRLG